MHVLNVNHTLDPVTGGGTAERTIKMSQFLARAGVTCKVLAGSAGFDAARFPPQEKLRFVTVPLLSKRFFIPLISGARLRRLVDEADVIHLMGHWSLLNALVYRAARRLGKPYVVCPAGALPIYGRSRLFKRLYNLIVGNKLIRNASAKIAITEAERDHFRSYGIAPHEVLVIPNGVDPDEDADSDPAAFRTKYGLQRHPFVLFMGRLNPIKGPDLLLEAFSGIKSKFPSWHLVYAGPDAGMLNNLRNKAQDDGLAERVHFLGYLGGRDKAAAYAAAGLLAIPSRQEAMSIVVLEAGVRKTPVLLTDQCGMNIVAKYGGKVVAATADGLESGLEEMLSAAHDLKRRGEELANFVRTNYLWNTVVQGYIAEYDELLRKRAA